VKKRRAAVRLIKPGMTPEEMPFGLGTWFRLERGDLVFESPLQDAPDPNDHLKWFYGMLWHDRKFFKRVQDKGVKVVASIHTSQKTLVLEPESLLLAHKLRMRLETNSV